MDGLARILLEVHPPDADALFPIARPETQDPMAGQGLLVLGDLVTLGQVGVEIVLAGEDAGRINLTFERQGDPQGEFDGPPVNHGQCAGQPAADRADGRVGRRLRQVNDRAAAEHFGTGEQFGVDFQADDGLVGHGAIICGGASR